MHVRPGRAEDLPFVSNVSADAMWDDEITEYICPYKDRYPTGMRDRTLLRCKQRFYKGERLIVAVTDEEDKDFDGHERVTGFAFWSTNLEARNKEPKPKSMLGNAFEQWALSVEENWSWYFGIDRSIDKQRVLDFRDSVANVAVFEQIPHYWELEVLAVSPAYQRRGIGSLLLQWGFDRGTEDNVPVILLASLRGENLYRKNGFRELGRVATPGLDTTWAAMIWLPLRLCTT